MYSGRLEVSTIQGHPLRGLPHAVGARAAVVHEIGSIMSAKLVTAAG